MSRVSPRGPFSLWPSPEQRTPASHRPGQGLPRWAPGPGVPYMLIKVRLSGAVARPCEAQRRGPAKSQWPLVPIASVTSRGPLSVPPPFRPERSYPRPFVRVPSIHLAWSLAGPPPRSGRLGTSPPPPPPPPPVCPGNASLVFILQSPPIPTERRPGRPNVKLPQRIETRFHCVPAVVPQSKNPPPQLNIGSPLYLSVTTGPVALYHPRPGSRWLGPTARREETRAKDQPKPTRNGWTPVRFPWPRASDPRRSPPPPRAHVDPPVRVVPTPVSLPARVLGSHSSLLNTRRLSLPGGIGDLKIEHFTVYPPKPRSMAGHSGRAMVPRNPGGGPRVAMVRNTSAPAFARADRVSPRVRHIPPVPLHPGRPDQVRLAFGRSIRIPPFGLQQPPAPDPPRGL